MALVGKWTKIEYIQSETETEIQTITYPVELPEGHPDFDKAGTTEEIEVPKINKVETVFENVYCVVHSINSWKQKIIEENKTLFNICFRVYASKEDRLNDNNSFIFEEHIISREVDYSLKENEIQQAYSLLNIQQGFEELTND